MERDLILARSGERNPQDNPPSLLAIAASQIKTLALKFVALNKANNQLEARLSEAERRLNNLETSQSLALQSVISGLDHTIRSMNGPKKIIRDKSGKPIGIEPSA